MPEQEENFVDTLYKVNSMDELKSALPPRITERLGPGQEGIKKTIALLISLTPFAPAPTTFSRDAFDHIVAVDEETEQLLPKEEQQKLLEVALEAGFIQKAEQKERYSVKKELQDAVNRVSGEA